MGVVLVVVIACVGVVSVGNCSGDVFEEIRITTNNIATVTNSIADASMLTWILFTCRLAQ